MALVVDNNSTYAHIGRPQPQNVAAGMAAVLRRLGFEVTTEFDAFPPSPCHTSPSPDRGRRPGTPAAVDEMAGCSMVVVDLDPQALATKWSDLRTADPVVTSGHAARFTPVGRSGRMLAGRRLTMIHMYYILRT